VEAQDRCGAHEGAKRLRSATREEARELPALGTWGYSVITRLAEARFTRG
jgi:hypothetical protein